MKKLIALLTVLAMLCSFAACAANENTTTEASTTAGNDAPTTGKPDDADKPDDNTGTTCNGHHETDPYVDVDVDAFYANYTTACCYEDACYRTKHYLLSGSLEMSNGADLSPTITDDRPTKADALVRNTGCYYLDDGNTYVVLDSQGNEKMRIYKGAAYISLEDVAAYMFAFGGGADDLPANYNKNKDTAPAASKWGKYLRVNHTNFKGNTQKYPRQPELPGITGCGGKLYYYELDLGTVFYNDGTKINRGACRLVHVRQDLNENGVFDNDEVFVFYTYNHYEDFQEYLNYYNGWSDRFGYSTGLREGLDGPSAYIKTAYADFKTGDDNTENDKFGAPTCGGHASDPYVNVDVDAFYANYTTACCYQDACYRTEHYLLSGSLYQADATAYAPTIDENRVTGGDALVRNTGCYYRDNGNTYVVLDSRGNEKMRIYKGAAYISLEDVAAYMFAFGGGEKDLPANYDSNKRAKPANSPWGKYLRVNHTNFTGDTHKHPTEPELPNITGCGGKLYYWEMDIGTQYYNDGKKIDRGTCRLVHVRQDLNGDGVFSNDEVYVFFTYNHYNDFQEYLNYYNGWSDKFGHKTGLAAGLSEPTPYLQTGYADFTEKANTAA